MTNYEKKYGRTFFDLIAENPKFTFFIFLSLLFIAILLIFFRVPFKVGNVEFGDNKQVVHDTITKVKTEILYVNNQKVAPLSKKGTLKKENSNKITLKSGDTIVSVQDQSANINTGTNIGIIGNNNVLNQAPLPTLKVKQISYLDQKSVENLTKLNNDLIGYENNVCYKTGIIFYYNSDSKKDYIDFKMYLNNILHVETKKLDEMYEISNWVNKNKITGIRFYNPSNGLYEMIIYSSTPIIDFWKYFRFFVNNQELPVTS